jgi:hypothetical protein
MMKVMSANKALNIIYPTDESVQKFTNNDPLDDLSHFQNKLGNVMTFEENYKNYQYIDTSSNSRTNHLFSPAKIGNYSAKLKTISDCISNSEGIIVIFSQYIESGVIPVALMLEEMGFSRKANNSTANLFKTPPAQSNRAFYTLITGTPSLSPNNPVDVTALNQPENIDGNIVKVAIISMAGAEGIDFKNVRQVHILDAWYNLSRLEQIIGRGVRFRSHCNLPFEKRNVQIYIHGSKLHPELGDFEPVDLYMYRKAEMKSIQIGKVTRLLKETAVDCLLTENQSLLTQEELKKVESNQQIECLLSDGSRIQYQPGDQPFTNMCDWMDTCYYKCNVGGNPTTSREIDATSSIQYSTYSTHHINTYVDSIHTRIYDLFQTEQIYDKTELIRHIQYTREYPLDAIYSTLNDYIQYPDQYPIVNAKGTVGRLRRSAHQYFFQPNAITDPYSSLQENMLFAPKPNRERIGETADLVLDDSPVDESRLLADEKQLLLNYVHALTDPNSLEPSASVWVKNFVDIVRDIPPGSVSIPQLFVNHWMDAMSRSIRFLFLQDTILRLHGPENATDSSYFELNTFLDEYFNTHRVIHRKTSVYMMLNPVKKSANTGVSYYFYSPAKKAVIKVMENEIPKIHANVRETVPTFSSVVGFYSTTTDTTSQFKLLDRMTPTQGKGKLKGVVCGTGKMTPSMWLDKIIEFVPPDMIPYGPDPQSATTSITCVWVEILLRWLTMESKGSRVYMVTPELEYIYHSTLFPTGTGMGPGTV